MRTVTVKWTITEAVLPLTAQTLIAVTSGDTRDSTEVSGTKDNFPNIYNENRLAYLQAVFCYQECCVLNTCSASSSTQPEK